MKRMKNFKKIVLIGLLGIVVVLSGCTKKEELTCEISVKTTCEEFGGVCKSECNETEGYVTNPTECSEACCAPFDCPEHDVCWNVEYSSGCETTTITIETITIVNTGIKTKDWVETTTTTIDRSGGHHLCVNADNITIDDIDYDFGNIRTICFWFMNGELYIDGERLNDKT